MHRTQRKGELYRLCEDTCSAHAGAGGPQIEAGSTILDMQSKGRHRLKGGRTGEGVIVQ